jgi:hypothetical protein
MACGVGRVLKFVPERSAPGNRIDRLSGFFGLAVIIHHSTPAREKIKNVLTDSGPDPSGGRQKWGSSG